MDIVKDLGSVIGLVLSCITLLTICCKPLRKRVADWIHKTAGTSENNQLMAELRDMLQNHISLDEKKQEQMEAVKEAMVDILRDNINRIYFQYVDKKELPAYEKKSLVILFQQYKKMGGNAYVHELYEELMEFPIAHREA